MKCPCCGEQRNVELLFHNSAVYLASGETLLDRGHVLETFERLLKGPIPMPPASTRANSEVYTYVKISNLRKFLTDMELPYEVITDKVKRKYILRKREVTNGKLGKVNGSAGVHSSRM